MSAQWEKCSGEAVKSCLIRTFPIFSWLHSYKKDDFVGDVVSGCTVAIMHIPQGMGYALLGNLPPVVGIYMAFFPVLMYVLFGTSRHNSMGMKSRIPSRFTLTNNSPTGTFAVISIMVGKCVNKFSNIETGIANATITQMNETATGYSYSPIEIATLVCFMVGMIQVKITNSRKLSLHTLANNLLIALQLLMYVFRLGALSFLLSECLVSGFTTGAAIQVLTSQVKDLLGLQLPRLKGNFKMIKVSDGTNCERGD